MTEIDFLPVGGGQGSGDAIAVRLRDPSTGNPAVVVVDAGYHDDGEALVEHILKYYGTTTVDLAILTHPDGDHIGGMGEVVRQLEVKRLWLHDLRAHGGAALPASAAVTDLISVARDQGTAVEEPWAGDHAFGGSLRILGPDKGYYEDLVSQQLEGTSTFSASARVLKEAVRGVFDRISGVLGIEIPFEEKEVSPRNNSSIIVSLMTDGTRQMLTADAGVPAIDRALDVADELNMTDEISFVQIPHHGSRRNASSALLDRMIGPVGQDPGARTAFISAVADSEKHPSAKVVNAYKRRGCNVAVTAGNAICHGPWQSRAGWGPIDPLPPMDESGED